MKKISIILLFLAAVCPLAQAQRVKVYVTDAWDKPLGEVAVTLGRGRIPVAVTGADGMAEVDAGEGDRMTLTLLNRMSRTVAVSGGEMHIRLTDDDVLFDVGYDERVRKGSASASLAGAAAREIEAGGRTDLMSNLYGLIPGLGVRQGENLPWDSAPDLNVRGVGSFGGNSVVVLVDGIERDAACLDREEVERITVLKDAASLALYGNRGADGIVAVTTRRGGDHGLRTRIDYNFSVQTPFRIPDMADAATYATAVNEALENDGLAPRYTQRDIRSMVRGERTDVLPNVDWRKAVLRNAGFNHDLNLSFDGSSRMPYGDKYRFYPAVSGAWIISNEAFLRDSRVVDLLKLRASFGIVGMDARLSYDMDKQFNGPGNSYIFAGITSSNSLAQGALPSAGIEPERDYKTNVGLELSLLGSLSVEVDFFRNMRHNIRTSAAGTVSSVLGVGVPDVFTGKVRNYGGELAVGWRRRTGDFGYAVRGNIAYARNKILNKEEEYKPFDYMRITGQPVGTFYGLVADGMYQDGDFNADGSLREGLPVSSYQNTVRPGDVKYRDLNRDGRIDDYDRTYQLYAAVPEIYYGFSVELKYRGFGVSAYFQGVAHSTLETTLSSIYQPLYGNDRNVSEYYMEHRWSRFNTEGRYPRLTTLANGNNYTQSSLWTENGNFLKLRTLQAYYKLPSKIARKLRMRECSFYFRGLNLFSADHVGILDPEYVSTGYPSSRSYQIGLNVIF